MRFRVVLRELGAVFEGEIPVPGPSMGTARIGDQYITIFADQWIVDISGADDLVQKVLEMMKPRCPGTAPARKDALQE